MMAILMPLYLKENTAYNEDLLQLHADLVTLTQINAKKKYEEMLSLTREICKWTGSANPLRVTAMHVEWWKQIVWSRP